MRFGLKPVAGKVADADQFGGGLFSLSHLRAPSIQSIAVWIQSTAKRAL